MSARAERRWVTAAEEPATDREAVTKAIEQAIGWAIEKDFDAMFRLWADDLFHFWLTSDSQVVGLEDFKTYRRALAGP